MAKQIKLTDETYLQLKGMADEAMRPVSKQVEYLMNFHEATPTARAFAEGKLENDKLNRQYPEGPRGPMRTFGTPREDTMPASPDEPILVKGDDY